MSAKSYKLGRLLSSARYTLKFFVDYHERLANESEKHHSLQKIISNKLIETYYQPILSLNEEKTLGYEALNRPLKTDTFISTEQFYDFVGHSSRLNEIESLCRNLAVDRFDNQLKDNQPDQLLFININPKVLADANFVSGKTLELLKKRQLKPSQIVLEVTEKDAVHDYQAFINVLHYYRNQGFRIAVDDAGTGYNSLKTLVFLQPEFIKIDRSIIHGVAKHRFQQEMVQLLLDYANRVKTEVIAEGIEEQEDYLYLKQLGVHYGQGYLINKPHQSINQSLFQSI